MLLFRQMRLSYIMPKCMADKSEIRGVAARLLQTADTSDSEMMPHLDHISSLSHTVSLARVCFCIGPGHEVWDILDPVSAFHYSNRSQPMEVRLSDLWSTTAGPVRESLNVDARRIGKEPDYKAGGHSQIC